MLRFESTLNVSVDISGCLKVNSSAFDIFSSDKTSQSKDDSNETERRAAAADDEDDD